MYYVISNIHFEEIDIVTAKFAASPSYHHLDCESAKQVITFDHIIVPTSKRRDKYVIGVQIGDRQLSITF